MKEPTYKVVGNLDYLANRDASNWSPQFDLSPWDIADSSSMYREYILRISSNQTGVEKTISLKVLESHARSAQQPVLGSVQIHRNLVPELESENTLYVITDVVLASYVELMIRIGDRQIVFVCDRDMPIGFKYHKYRLTRSGTFIYELNTSLKVLDKEAIWLRPTPQPIPAHPQWTITRRRYPNVARRRTKNNLTIPTPLEVPGMNRVISPLEVGILRNHHLPPIPEQDMEFAEQQVNEEEINRWPDRLLQRFALRPRNRGPHRTVSMVTMPGND